MEVFNNYFDGLIFSYIEEKKGFAVYVAALYGQVASDQVRYILAFVPSHLGIQGTSKLKDLPWKNLQMRMCPKSAYKVRVQSWKAPAGSTNINFKVVSRGDKFSKYTLVTDKYKTKYSKQDVVDESFPYEILMIHNPKKHTVFQFPNTMNFDFAIDQFRTVFNYVGSNVYSGNYQPPKIEYISMNEPQHIYNENIKFYNKIPHEGYFAMDISLQGNIYKETPSSYNQPNNEIEFVSQNNSNFQSPHISVNNSEIDFINGYFGDKELHKSNYSTFGETYGYADMQLI